MTPRSLGRNLRPEVSLEDEEEYLWTLKIALHEAGITSELTSWRICWRTHKPAPPSLKAGDCKISMTGVLYQINRSKSPDAPAVRSGVEAVIRYLQKADAEQLPLLVNR
jgi:hypothetical protein